LAKLIESNQKGQRGMGFPITTGTIIVIIDYDWVYYFLYFLYISFVFLLTYKNPYLVGRE